MTPYLFWWTNKHTCTLTVSCCPVACCVTRQFALSNPSVTDKDGMNHYCHLPYMRNQGDGTTGNELRLVSCHQDGSHVRSFTQLFGGNLLRTRSIVTLILSRWFRCQSRMSTHTGVGSSQRVRHGKPYFSVKCNYSRGAVFETSVTSFWL